ncbi:bifunctional diaminohydroxyphosphoribosylaminopyrimidine deaminase/5-amino-6-(5-phosphoribosylamino)uracil reductase RibD [Agrococcus sp. SGAir0287]|uniref:bifunctional diaminohydroxyphosphoribosylaminopyrimidine deaminase/5-amino-6-(5-phosphoribosylamino)uracil reductase RibD n=1 Tax=Agrococcus sp. SGAir0287 TaxID=2070347 RepID=UPI0010CCCBDD|nr:bifunctional diaminohydroxyphosphoribosylaminopyrimidine deaminase/5-amino-6-(5-phosphoribosylamino)uracil reductase RibD [Agrococcus sp. SGAir0287]QCR20629.1 bifunctional diaminohydroxyphosphoribosylaminopyrimidine deaminase/5-amino-6-(5-phosphoribosylamino)uracil reductase RibD [Agrococcus sp. SGAir0287]
MTTGQAAAAAPTRAERDALDRALAIAARGPRGLNPQVGCVILAADGTVLAEGWHRGAGTPHAEVDALSHLSAGAAHGATAVVTLEPCNHTGRTGPCAVAIVDAGIARVVYAVADPGEASSGGADRLRAGGVDVVHAADDRADALVDDWRFAMRHGRPRVTVKWAQSLDGRAAAADGTSQWITGPEARAHVHRQRSLHDAIAVGTGTVLADDPQLTARVPLVDGSDDPGAPQPLPVVVGHRDVPPSARLRDHPRRYVQVHGLPGEWLATLWREHGIQALYVEGGPTLASAVVAAGLADRIHCYVAPTLLGGPRTAMADVGVATIDEQLLLDDVRVEPLGRDLLVIAVPRPATIRPAATAAKEG